MNVSLTPELERFIAEKVQSGRYTSASELVREALRLFEEQDQLKQKRLKDIQNKDRSLKKLDDGLGIPGEQARSNLHLSSNSEEKGPKKMIKNTELREITFEWISNLPKGKVFSNRDMYKYLEENFFQECHLRGDAAREPRFRNDARWAVQDAKRANLARDIGSTGQHQRI